MPGFRPFLLLAACGCALLPSYAAAQAAATAAQAAAAVQARLGQAMLTAVAQVDGRAGTPHPGAWEFRVADPLSRTGLRLITTGRRGVSDRGAAPTGYPEAIPSGFFEWGAVQVDSSAAFSAAERAAASARVSFNSADYTLRAAEGTARPVWFLTLQDVAGRIVGRVEVSANNGEVLRLVWIRYATPGSRTASGVVRVEDSLAPDPAMRPPAPVILPPTPVLPVSPDGVPPLPEPVIPGGAGIVDPSAGQTEFLDPQGPAPAFPPAPVEDARQGNGFIPEP